MPSEPTDSATASETAPTLLVAGTASHVGKSTVAAGLCRLLADRGVSVAPFKAQNMSNNAQVALTPDGEFGEMGVSQYAQARAARVTPTTDTNPVLLKPSADGESQVVVDGEAVGHVAAGEYYESNWERAREAAIAAYERLAAEHDVVVAEGAGGVAEINLQHRDLANVETARFADASILLLVDIERGGAFASLYGTLELMPPDLRDRVVGAAITKFRGDESLLTDGIETIERETGVPILGVLPYDDPGLPEEDSVSLGASEETRVLGDDDGVAPDRSVRVVVPRLPRISNVTDFEPLARVPGVRVEFRPLGATLDGADAVVLPGTKNTVGDLRALRAAGFDDRLADFAGPVVGICGGYQLLGERITNAGVETPGAPESVSGLGLLPVETRFGPKKRVERVTVSVVGSDSGLLAGVRGDVTGYEIHMGETSLLDTRPDSVTRPLGGRSAATDDVLGTYLHGLFDDDLLRSGFVDAVFASADRTRPDAGESPASPYESAASLVATHLDTRSLFASLGLRS
ncbi:cobyric acid synthase [Halomarina salina]|uniref:Probable cobyric acid synthase n=1 Tax=Halomarina salina TaxID=1872699 RepID=A0ABD5RH28_9EURY|nr:cobyric acid synthase [Halomarina salina]